MPRFGLHLELISEIICETKLPTEIHLMSVQPEMHIPKLLEIGTSRIIVHVESTTHPHRILSEIKNHQIEVGVALNPSTPISSIEYLTDVFDYVLLMSINPGIPKHAIIPSTFAKLKKLREFFKESSIDKKVGIDGGVNFDNLIELYEYGADLLVGGSGTVFSDSAELRENISKVMKLKSIELA